MRYLHFFELYTSPPPLTTSSQASLGNWKKLIPSPEPFFSCDPWEPLWRRKRASFLQKRKKWHFFREKVCYVVIPRYLCIRKRTGSGHSRTCFPRHAFVVPSSCLRFRRRRKDGGKYEVRAKNYEVSGGCQSSIPNFKNKSSLTCLLLGCHRTALRLYGVIKIQHLRCCWKISQI